MLLAGQLVIPASEPAGSITKWQTFVLTGVGHPAEYKRIATRIRVKSKKINQTHTKEKIQESERNRSDLESENRRSYVGSGTC